MYRIYTCSPISARKSDKGFYCSTWALLILLFRQRVGTIASSKPVKLPATLPIRTLLPSRGTSSGRYDCNLAPADILAVSVMADTAGIIPHGLPVDD